MKMTKTKISCIIFDFGNVLLDWDVRYLYRPYFQDDQSMQDFLNAIDFYHWNSQQDAGRPFSEGIAELTSQYPAYDRLIRLYDEDYPRSLKGAIDGSVRILSRLRLRGWPVYGLSNYSVEKFRLIKPDYPFFNWFDGYLLSGEVGITKPDRRIFEILLGRIHRSAEESIFIDDSPANIEAARQLGFEVILFTSPADLESELMDREIL